MSLEQAGSPHTGPGGQARWQRGFIDQHQLDGAYLDSARIWFMPLVHILSMHQNKAKRPLLVAVNGSQGSGKTTLCDYLVAALQAEHGLRALALSLDDFYLGARQRQALATEVHPLFATRGVPGTHDMRLLELTLDGLLATGGSDRSVRVPRFDKAVDDRRPESQWDDIAGGVDVVLLEGWCMGALAQNASELVAPGNTLEAEEDPTGAWRSHVNDVLQRDFPALYQRVDVWLMLQAPSFDCVFRWRLEQEQKLAARVAADSAGVMSEEQIARFIMYYQRITEHCLARLPGRVDHLYCLDEQRRVIAHHTPVARGDKP